MKTYIVLFFIIILFSSELLSQTKDNARILSSEKGRFVFGQISEYRRDQYMLDTQTGRLWHIVVNDKEIQSLEPILYILLDGTKTIEPEDSEIELKKYREWFEKNKD